MVKIKKKENGKIKMTLSEEDFNTLISYMAVGISGQAEDYAIEHDLKIQNFSKQAELFEKMVNHIKNK